jgi:phosphatidate cytidylyltransferase
VIVSSVHAVNPLHSLGLGRSELLLRVCSALVLAPLAIVTAYVGGWWFAAFWGIAALGTFWEWSALMAATHRRSIMTIGALSIAIAIAFAAAGHAIVGLAVVAIGTVATASLTPAQMRIWLAAGVPYSASIAAAPIMLRADAQYGFLAVLFLFAIVWGSDIAAYFFGRAIGGAKLLPQVSPKKTWSGAIAGTAAAIAAGLIVARAAGVAGSFALAMLAAVLSVFSQAGDLLESFLKRRFGAKDTSRLIPGHGGLMDRLDAFVVASVVATLIGIARGGLEAPGRGLLVW